MWSGRATAAPAGTVVRSGGARSTSHFACKRRQMTAENYPQWWFAVAKYAGGGAGGGRQTTGETANNLSDYEPGKLTGRLAALCSPHSPGPSRPLPCVARASGRGPARRPPAHARRRGGRAGPGERDSGRPARQLPAPEALTIPPVEDVPCLRNIHGTAEEACGQNACLAGQTAAAPAPHDGIAGLISFRPVGRRRSGSPHERFSGALVLPPVHVRKRDV